MKRNSAENVPLDRDDTSVAKAESTRPVPELVEQAAHWHTLMQSDEVTEDRKAAFAMWHATPEHAAAYERIEAMWGQIDDVGKDTAHDIVEKILASQKDDARKRKRQRALTTTFGLLLIGAFIGIQATPGGNGFDDYVLSGRLLSDHSTTVGEHRIITLSDRTRLHLNTFSSVNIEYTDKQRTIHLLQGEIRIDVAKDTERPLVVLNGPASARALGTRFSVRDRGDLTEVGVTESTVEVCALKTRQCRTVNAGETTRISGDEVLPPRAMNERLVHDWSRRLLIVDNQPVLDVLDELTRYHTGFVRIDRNALADDTVSGVFALDHFAKSIQALEASVPIEVDSYAGFLTIIGKK